MKRFLILALAGLAGLAAAQQYQVVDLGVVDPNDYGSRATAISSNDIVAGWSGGPYTAFTWTQGGGMTALPHWDSYPYAFAQAVNSSGDAGGYVQDGFNGPYKPAIWHNGAVDVAPQLDGTSGGKIFSMSDTGYSVGFENGDFGGEVAFRYDGNQIISLGSLSTGEALADAYGVNDAGQVVGQAYTTSSYKAWIWDEAHGGVEIAPLAGDDGAIAWAINNSGMVIGSSLLHQGVTSRGFWWTEADGIHEIPGLNGSDDFQLRGVNDAGAAVGIDFATGAAILWNGSTTLDLNGLIGSQADDWDLGAAYGINDHGIIVGQGDYQGLTRAYALVPVPEPGTLLALGLGGAWLMRRRAVKN